MKRLFIIGAMRSGSSSIATYLKQHPDVISSSVKEPNFMIFYEQDKTYLRSDGTKLQLQRYATELESYEALYASGSSDGIAIDASSSYISYPQAAENIYKLYPDAYILATLRDPVERAISAYKFNRARGTETRDDFVSILSGEIDGKDKGIFAPWRYIHCGKYSDNLAPYFNTFSSDKMYIQNFDTFKTDPQNALKELTEFLGLKPYQYDVSFKVNSSAAPNALSRIINKILIKNSEPIKILRSCVKKAFPKLKTVDVLTTIEGIKNGSKPPIVTTTFDEERQMLESVFAKDLTVSKIIASKARE